MEADFLSFTFFKVISEVALNGVEMDYRLVKGWRSSVEIGVRIRLRIVTWLMYGQFRP